MLTREPTNSEAWLSQIATSTFLSLWSIRSPFRNQGQRGSGDGKEICDLLVVFGNDIIVFSDKDCKLVPTDDVRTGWSRWYKRAIADSAKQAVGAARWLQQYPDRVWSDPKCTVGLPITLPIGPSVRFHLVVVAHDGLYQDHSSVWPPRGLSIDTTIVGRAHCELKTDQYVSPFAVGRTLNAGPFIHVFDQQGIDLVLQHNDTVTDFLRYLTDREKFLQETEVRSSSEHDLLAAYFSHFDEQTERYWFHDLPFPPLVPVEYDDEWWNGYETSDRLRRRKEANEPSYLVDALLEHFTTHLLAGTTVAGGDARTVEPALRQLAGLSRTDRRAVGAAMTFVKQKTGAGQRRLRVMGVPGRRTFWVAIFAMARWPNVEEFQYREERRAWLEALLLIVRLREKDAEHLVGIAFDAAPAGSPQSEDIMYLDGRHWSAELEERARELQRQTGLLQNATVSRATDFDYPDETVRPAPAGLDEPCPCGRPLRFRECCARRYSRLASD